MRKKIKIEFAFLLLLSLLVLFISLKIKLIRISRNEDVFWTFVLKKQHYKRNDFVIYKVGENYFTGRIIAIPGDTVKIENGLAVVNNVFERDFKKRCFLYFVFGKKIFLDALSKYKFAEPNVFCLNLYQADALKGLLVLDKIREPKNFNSKKIFPYSYKYRWNAYFWGPAVVPGKKQALEKRNVLYKNVKFENGTVSDDYYFILNDRRFDFTDSRTWGFIEKNKISGKIVFYFLKKAL